MSLADAIDTIRPSVVQISLFSRTNHLKRPIVGTGFWIHDDGYVLTARHVIEGGRDFLKTQNISDGEFMIGLAAPNTDSMRGNFTLLSADIVAEDERHDIALLKSSRNPFKDNVTSGIVINGKPIPLPSRVILAHDERPRDGDPVAISGYPLSETVMITTSGALASAWGVDIKDVPIEGAPAGFTIPDIMNSYFVDASVNPGNSGGPVYSIIDSSVIGVCVAYRSVNVQAGGNPAKDTQGTYLTYNSGLSIAVPIKYGLELLNRTIHKDN